MADDALKKKLAEKSWLQKAGEFLAPGKLVQAYEKPDLSSPYYLNKKTPEAYKKKKGLLDGED